MNRERLSSDSSSWSLVDVDNQSDSDIDVSIANNLNVESIYDSESEQSGEELEIEEDVLEDEIDIDDGSDVGSVHENEEEIVIEEQVELDISEKSDHESDAEESVYSDDENESDQEISDESDEEKENTVELVEEEEIMAEAAALHYVEPTKVIRKFEELCKSLSSPSILDEISIIAECTSSPFDNVIKKFIPKESERSMTFLIVVFITIFGAFIGQYIGACLIGNLPRTTDGSYCLESDRILLEPSGLQYQEASTSEFVPESKQKDELLTCKEELDDAKAEVKMKQGVNRFVREMYKKQLAQTKKEFESRLALYQRASRRHFALQKTMNILPSNVKNTTTSTNASESTSEFCSLVEKKIFNLTRSISNWTMQQQKVFNSVSNWTRNQPVVKSLINLSPKFDESLDKVSKWLKSSRSFRELPKLPNLSTKMFDSVQTKVGNFLKTDFTSKLPKLSSKMFNSVQSKVGNFLKSDFSTKAKEVFSTALTKTNLSTKISAYRRHPMVNEIKNNIKSVMSKISTFSLSKFAADVCFTKNTCSSAEKLIKTLKDDVEFINKIGKKQFIEYEQFLKSLSSNNCSKQLECERDWWLGCGPQFLENCELQQWQEKRWFSAPAFINRKKQLKDSMVNIGWIESKDRRTPIRCPKLSTSPLPCPASKVLPDLPQEELAPCHPGPNSAKPCQSGPLKSKPCSAKSKKSPKPTGNERSDWTTERAAVRAKQRSVNQPKESPNWFVERAKVRAQQRSIKAAPVKKTKKNH